MAPQGVALLVHSQTTAKSRNEEGQRRDWAAGAGQRCSAVAVEPRGTQVWTRLCLGVVQSGRRGACSVLEPRTSDWGWIGHTEGSGHRFRGPAPRDLDLGRSQDRCLGPGVGYRALDPK